MNVYGASFDYDDSPLTSQVPVEKIVETFVDVPCERIVEKIVEVPVERVVVKEVPVEVIKEVVVEKIVEVTHFPAFLIFGLNFHFYSHRTYRSMH